MAQPAQSNGQELQVKPASLPRMESVERISKLPVVEQTVDLAANFYGKVKDSNTLVNSVLTTAETTVKGAVDKTIPPMTARLEGPIKQIDTMLCTGLDYVETKIPAVKLKPDEIVKNTKDYVSTIPGVKCACEYGEQGVKRAVECACAVSQFGAQKLNEIKDCLVASGNQQALPKSDDKKNVIGVYILSTFTFLFSLISSWFGVNIYIDESNNIKTVKRNKHLSIKDRLPTKDKIVVNGSSSIIKHNSEENNTLDFQTWNNNFLQSWYNWFHVSSQAEDKHILGASTGVLSNLTIPLRGNVQLSFNLQCLASYQPITTLCDEAENEIQANHNNQIQSD